jgi:hypothetical protein
MRHLVYLFILCGLAVGGCADSNKLEGSVDLVPNGKLALSLDSLTPNQMKVQYLLDQKSGREYLICRGRQNRILFYDLATKQRAFVVRFAEEGPNGVGGELSTFYAHSLDSIFLETSPVYFYLTDTSGRIKKTFSLIEQADSQGIAITSYATVVNQNIVWYAGGQNFHFFRWPDGFGSDPKVRKQPFLAQMDLGTGKVEMLPAFYPNLYQQYFWSLIHMDAGITRAPNGFVFNFPGCDSVYAWQDGQTVAHYAASRYITTPIKPVLNVPTTEEGLHRPVIEQQCYAFLAYDPWRQVYYRIAWHPHDDLSNVGNILRIYAEKPCSIIILDKNLNIIGETMLPRDRYFTMRWFIGPKGLYISDAHPDNPDLDEDVLSYTLFTLAEKKDG